MSGEGREREIHDWYSTYYRSKGEDRNDVLTNAGVFFQYVAVRKSIIESLRTLQVDRSNWKILDVGCGAGGSLAGLMEIGFSPELLHGIDIRSSKIHDASSNFPTMNLRCGDAADMPYESDAFDLVLESTMFIQLTDADASRIAHEMLRVTKIGGYLMLIDWRYGSPRHGYNGLTRRRIKHLFGVGSSSVIITSKHGALIPPLGRLLSKYCPPIYFLVGKAIPPLVGQMTTILKKIAGARSLADFDGSIGV